MKRRDVVRAAAWALLAPRALRGASLRAFGGELVAALLEPAKPTLAGSNPRTLDPFAARTRLEREIAAALHLPLVGPARPGRPHGLLLDSASQSGRTWTFTLRGGLTFPDGSPADAADAVASLLRLPAGVAALLEIDGVEARGPLSFTVATKRAQPSLPDMLSAFAIPLAAAEPGDAFFGPRGLGAFAPAPPGAGRPSADIVLAANVRSPAGRAYLDRLVLTRVPEGPALATALRRGQVHVAAAQTTMPEVSGAKLVSGDAAATIVLGIGPRVQPALRQRIAASPDRRILADVFLNGRVKPATTILPPALLGPLGAGPLPAMAPQKGAKTPVSMFVANASAEIGDVAERLVWDLQAAGVAATIGWRHPADFEVEATRGRADLMLFEWSPACADAGWALGAEQASPAGLLRGTDGGPALAGDPDTRFRNARTLDDTLRASGQLVPIAHPIRLLRASPRVDGIALDALGRVSWADVSFKRGAE